MNDRYMDESCGVCAQSGGLDAYLCVSLVGVLDAAVYRCPACGFRQVRPPLTRAQLASCYPPVYFDSGGSIGFKDYARQKQRQEREGYFLAKELRRLAPRGRLLEVGCALGFLLDALRRFSGWTVEGLDISELAVFFAHSRFGLQAKAGTLEEAAYPDGHFDFVIQKDLLEHVTDPRSHLLETHRILRPGGRLWLVTPNGEANLRPLRRASRRLRAKGSDELPLLDQAHLSFFKRENLNALLSECGFRCLRFRNIGVRRGLRALGFLPAKKRGAQTVARRGAPPPPGESPPAAATDHEALAERIDDELRTHHRPVRSRVPYFYFRQSMISLDTLPGWVPLGIDFEVLLERA